MQVAESRMESRCIAPAPIGCGLASVAQTPMSSHEFTVLLVEVDVTLLTAGANGFRGDFGIF